MTHVGSAGDILAGDILPVRTVGDWLLAMNARHAVRFRVATTIAPSIPRLPRGLRVGAVVRRETLVKALGIGAVDGLVLAGALQPRYP